MAGFKRLLICCALVIGSGFINTQAGDVELPVLPRGKGENCVEPTEIMRRQHIDFLHHQRDETVHDGVRTKKHSLHECVSCHAQKDEAGEFVSVNAPEQFCQSCHAFASVKLDCFECHASRPSNDLALGDSETSKDWSALQIGLIDAYQLMPKN